MHYDLKLCLKLEIHCIIQDIITVNKLQIQHEEAIYAKVTDYIILENAHAVKNFLQEIR